MGIDAAGWLVLPLANKEENNKYFLNKLFNLVSGINKKVFFTTLWRTERAVLTQLQRTKML